MKQNSMPAWGAKGFTLIEMMLVVATMAILATVVIASINPTQQVAITRNAVRSTDVQTVVNAIVQYVNDTGSFPTSIPLSNNCNESGHEICKSDGSVSCDGMVDLTVLRQNEKYIIALPTDPLNSKVSNGTGYFVSKDANNRVTVCAPSAEQSVTITKSG